ncbi:MAG: hypothetical protein Q8N51_17950 [Gammaproteobacteria bacterium]|nr:hypothetical protein [Gammaproteobacteria bacterium]
MTAISGYALQAGLFGLAFAATRAVGDWSGALQSRSMQFLLIGTAGALLLGITGLLLARRVAGVDQKRQFQLPLVASIVTGVLCFLSIEIGVRLIATADPLGTRIGSTVLLPYDWPAMVEANQAMLARSRQPDAFYIPDSELGWAVGPSRRSKDGLYLSSPEGLRSAVQGGQQEIGLPAERVALYGNSFAFSEEVAFQDSLAPKLERELAPGARVLNFGVPGFGVDQAVLRFRQTAGKWSPRVAILTFIEDDLYRVANVYAFLKVDWGLPVSKPRFVLEGDELHLKNVPTLSGDDLFGHPSIFDLPLLDHDIEFQAQRWRHHPLHASYVIRLLNGLFPTWPPKSDLVSDETIAAVSARVIQEFESAAIDARVVPVIAYFPTSGDYSPGGRRDLKRRVLANLSVMGVPVADLTQCIADNVPQAELFVPGGHYTGPGNAGVAACLAPLVRAANQAEPGSP